MKPLLILVVALSCLTVVVTAGRDAPGDERPWADPPPASVGALLRLPEAGWELVESVVAGLASALTGVLDGMRTLPLDLSQPARGVASIGEDGFLFVDGTGVLLAVTSSGVKVRAYEGTFVGAARTSDGIRLLDAAASRVLLLGSDLGVRSHLRLQPPPRGERWTSLLGHESAEEIGVVGDAGTVVWMAVDGAEIRRERIPVEGRVTGATLVGRGELRVTTPSDLVIFDRSTEPSAPWRCRDRLPLAELSFPGKLSAVGAGVLVLELEDDGGLVLLPL